MILRPWTEAEQASHRADLLAAVPHGNKGQRRSRPREREMAPNKPGFPNFENREAPHVRRAKSETLEELLAEW